jgi:tetratricopeptide (TPR) repeat protein
MANLFQLARDERGYHREIDDNYQLRLMAADLHRVKKCSQQMLAAQLRAAQDAVQGREYFEPRGAEEILSRGFESINHALDEIKEGQRETVAAIREVYVAVNAFTDRICERIARLEKWEQEIAETLRRPYKTKALELREEADKSITKAASYDGKDQRETFEDALGLLRAAVGPDNPMGQQDFVTCFQIGWLLWKLESNFPEAERAFDRVRRLTIATNEVWHIRALRHLAYMQYLQGKYEEAFTTAEQALNKDRSCATLFDSARYAALSKQPDTTIALLDECIGFEPLMFNTMFGEPDFRGIRLLIGGLATRKQDKVCSVVLKNLERCRRICAIRRETAVKSGVAVEIEPQLLVSVKELEECILKADYIQLLSLQKRSRELIHSLTQAIVESMQAHINGIQDAITADTARFQIIGAELVTRIRKEREKLLDARAIAEQGGIFYQPDKKAFRSHRLEYLAATVMFVGLGITAVGILPYFDESADSRFDLSWMIMAGVCIVGIGFAIFPFIWAFDSSRWMHACLMGKLQARKDAKRNLVEMENSQSATLAEIESQGRAMQENLKTVIGENIKLRQKREECLNDLVRQLKVCED